MNDEEDHRRATAFLSDWIHRNSFRSNIRHLDGSVRAASSLAPDGGGRRGLAVQNKYSRRASSADPPLSRKAQDAENDVNSDGIGVWSYPNPSHRDGSVGGRSAHARDGSGGRGRAARRVVQNKYSRRASSADPPPTSSRKAHGAQNDVRNGFPSNGIGVWSYPNPRHLDGSVRGGSSHAPDGGGRRGRAAQCKYSRRASSADPPPVSSRKAHGADSNGIGIWSYPNPSHLDGSVRGASSLAPDGGGRRGRTARREHGRRASSADPPPVSLRQAHDTNNETVEGSGRQSSHGDVSAHKNHVCLPHLELGTALGEVGTARDMTMSESSRSITLKIVSSLRVHDFAFVLRSDGRWTYSIVADKRDDAMLFVVDLDGQTKLLSKKHWFTCIRLVNPDSEACAPRHIVACAQGNEKADHKSSNQKEEKDRKMQVTSAASEDGTMNTSERKQKGISTQILPSSPLSLPRNERNHFGWY